MKIIAKTIREAMKTPGFTSLYIGGVALTIAFTVVYGIILYGQLGPVYPEYNRNNTLYIEYTFAKDSRSNMSSGVGLPFINEFLRDSIKSIEDMTVMSKYNSRFTIVQPEGHGPEFRIEMRGVEPSFFNFYEYEFLAGKPFTQEELEAGDKVVAISEKVAKRLFPTPEDAVDENININHIIYRISGVFREASALCVDSYAEAFTPFMIINNEGNHWHSKYMGIYKAILKVKPGKADELREELREICRRINLVDTAAAKFYIPLARSHTERVLYSDDFKVDHNKDDYMVEAARSPFELSQSLLLGLLVVLLIPALNISGLISARMDRSRADIGVRRCFGATRSNLTRMVMTENLLLTVIGGIIGLILSWILVAFAGDALMKFTPLEQKWGSTIGSSSAIVTGEMAFAPVLFVAVFLLCVILNTLSAWIPTRIALHKQITESLNSKR